MLLVALLWGACFVAIQWGLRDASPLWFATLRALLAGVALLLVAVASGRHRLPTRRADWLRVTALALVNVTVAFGAMFLATGGTITGVASVLANAQPLLIVLPAWALYGERADAPTLGAMLAGLGGVALLAGGGGSGAGLALLAAAGITAGTLLLRQFSDLDLVTVSAWSFLIGGAALAGLAALVEGSPQIAWTPRFITVLLFLGLLGTALAFLLWFEEARRSPLAALSTWSLLAPVFGVLFGIGLLGERPSLRETIGLTIVVAAVAAVQAGQQQPHHHATAARSRARDRTRGLDVRGPSPRVSTPGGVETGETSKEHRV
jgi:drug/metabolite transporter (DMT)-like permease